VRGGRSRLSPGALFVGIVAMLGFILGYFAGRG